MILAKFHCVELPPPLQNTYTQISTHTDWWWLHWACGNDPSGPHAWKRTFFRWFEEVGQVEGHSILSDQNMGNWDKSPKGPNFTQHLQVKPVLLTPSSICRGSSQQADIFKVQTSPEMWPFQKPGTKWPPEPWFYLQRGRSQQAGSFKIQPSPVMLPLQQPATKWAQEPEVNLQGASQWTEFSKSNRDSRCNPFNS